MTASAGAMAPRLSPAIWKALLARGTGGDGSLQGRIREMLVSAILDRTLPPGTPVPSSREMAEHLGVARNTVVLAYQQLRDEGYLEARQRSGYFVDGGILAGRVLPSAPPPAGPPMDWERRLWLRPTAQRSISKPADWQTQPYPFLYGQFDPTLFPTADWRECCIKTLSVMGIREWAPDQIARDDDSLVQQIRTRVLPRRGVWAGADELIVTVGAQHALYMVADLLVRQNTRVAIEEPGYPDARNIFLCRTPNVLSLPVDACGLPVDGRLSGVDYVYVTPSHQCPTGVTMPIERRRALLAMADAEDFIVVEDDFESENRFDGEPIPALKSLDRSERVIYIGSLSKSLAPGLRIGYVVAAPPLIAELRALRRLMLRHPSTFVQRAFALFLSLGHHDAQMRRLAVAQRERFAVLVDAMQRHLPDCEVVPVSGGGSCWVRLPDGVSAVALVDRAAEAGVLIEPGDVFFRQSPPPAGYVRLGYQSITAAAIGPGIEALARVMARLQRAGSGGRSLR